MKIGIIGAGFTGLSAGYNLVKDGHQVTIFEKDPHPGGLAIGYQEKGWEWSLEKHYHHWFTNDESVLRLAKDISYDVLIKRPRTSAYVNGTIYQLDSPLHVLSFPELPLFDRLRMSAVLASLRYNPYWQPLERINASTFLPKVMGEKAYQMIWEPLLVNKFGSYAGSVSLAWFWARIKKRTASLAYPKKGFLPFAQAVVAAIEKQGGKIHFSSEINELKDTAQVHLVVKHGKESTSYTFDRVIVTTPSFLFLKFALQLPESYKAKLAKLKGLGAINIVLRLKNDFFSDNTYWLSICDKNSPIMAIVEHTHFMDKKYYNNEHLVYLGNYLPHTHRYFTLNKTELLKEYDQYLRKINPSYEKSLIGFEMFQAPFAQPVIPVNYSKMLPPFETPLAHVFLANIEQVYPWDRGTNYAVELGESIARIITKQS
ncbi:MAG: FAD-dependent oxidoreductase [Candidatus Levybacteria bacterium]|nr:FAD-dependent oxidoreductase [Candidatus Levybacteria bacterium]